METVTVKPVESRDQAIVRLAAQAHKKGVQLLHYSISDEWFATSTRNPGELHKLTMISCTCPGFFSHQRCMHHSLLLEELGQLPDPDPDPTETTNTEIICEVCSGDGYDGNTPCRACRGRGKSDITVAVVDVPNLDQWDLNQLRGVQCASCSGDGFKLVSTGGRLSDWDAETCKSCQGAGLVPVPAREFELIAA